MTITPIDISVKTRLSPEIQSAISKVDTPITRYLGKYSLPGYMWDEIAGAALIDPSIITGQKQFYMDIDIDHGASYGKTLFWGPTASVPPYLRMANVQFDIDAEKFYKLYIDLMTRPPGQARESRRRPSESCPERTDRGNKKGCVFYLPGFADGYLPAEWGQARRKIIINEDLLGTLAAAICKLLCC